MSDPVRYVTDQEGERIGVLLDLESYRHLQSQQLSRDSEELQGLSHEELQALTIAWFSPDAQARLDDLLARNTEGNLSSEEIVQLDELLAQADQLALLVARARLTLHRLGNTDSEQRPNPSERAQVRGNKGVRDAISQFPHETGGVIEGQ